MTAFDPAYALTGRLVDILSADAEHQRLLFSVTQATDTFDTRVYQSNVELPEGPIREVLPRVLVECASQPFNAEQSAIDAAVPQASVNVSIFTLVDADYRELGEALHARQRLVIASTPISDSHIIAAALVPTGLRVPVREVAFRNAWRFTHEYRSQLVGVIDG